MENDLRKVHLFPSGNSDSGKNFSDNRIVSSKYTLINFIPKNLFGQFRRVVNFFFLVLIILQFSIDIPVNPIPYVAAFAFVIGVTAIKQGFEDWRIHQSDNIVNNTLVNVFDKSEKVNKIKSRLIKVGQIIRLSNNESVPSDILLLCCTSENGKSVRQCQITTANLDGEANLKIRVCPPQLPNLTDGEEKFLLGLQQSIVHLEYDKPNSDLYQFMGNLTTSAHEKSIPLTMDNVLLRGSTVKNCQYVYGCAVYTGKETRLSLNSAKTKSNKFSTVESTMNKIVAAVFVMLLILCSIAVVMFFNRRESTEIANAWYLPTESGTDVELGLVTFISTLVLISYAIPVSLSVTIELQKFGCSMFFGWDEDMRCPNTGNMAICNTSDLNEELGQIEYLFTDKTGTLTENNLNFTSCSINGVQYDYKCRGNDSSLIVTDTEDPVLEPEKRLEIIEFLRFTALCHTVQTLSSENESGSPVQYIASSLDEEALIKAASSLGVKFLSEVDDTLTISVKEVMYKYTKHLTLDFDAERKCMSVIVEDDKGKILVLCKGAESALLPKSKERDGTVVASTMQHVEDFAKMGLRTLMLGCKEITSEEVQRYKDEAESRRRDVNGLKALYNEIEQNLEILGATGVEDQLQDGVPETLQALKMAGIKIWMLTGDKLETAVNVALSCGFIGSDDKSIFGNRSLLTKFTEITDAGVMDAKLQDAKKQMTKNRDSTVVMDGISLATGLDSCKDILCETTLQASQVIFCRMAPLQKAQVVRMIKSYKGKNLKTCAVGDGGNDVAMIQEAHIGIGIMGKEGRQATRASDFAVSRFRFLQKAILVHGYWYYQRLATLVVYFFYRGTAFIFQQFFYLFATVFSAQTIFHSTYVMLYTILFASVPILVYGLTEQSKSKQELLQKPQLYKEFNNNSIMSVKNCTGWILNTIWHFLLCYFVPWYMYQDYNGVADWGSYSLFIGSLVVAVTDLKVIVETKFFNWFTLGAQIFSYGIMFFFYSVFCQIGPGGAEWLQFSYYNLLSQPEFWLSLFLVSTLGVLPDVLVSAVKNRNTKVEDLKDSDSRSELMVSYEMKKI